MKQQMAQMRATVRVVVIGALVVLGAVFATGWFVDTAFASPDASPSSLTISGNVVLPLSPGTAQPVDLAFTNQSSSAITIAPRTFTITVTTSQAGCSAPANFAVKGMTTSVTVPDGAANVSLSDLGIDQTDWPIVSMIQTNTNQDASEDSTLALHYSAVAA